MNSQVDIARITKLIRDWPGNDRVQRVVSLLATRHGTWVYDAIIDNLSASNDTYPQRVQDSQNRSKSRREVRNRGSQIQVVLSEDCFDGLDNLAANVISLLDAIVPADYHELRKSAKLKPIQSDVFYYWLRGYSAKQMSTFMYAPGGSLYKPDSIRNILRKALKKVWECEAATWRTALAEDIHRGKDARKPNYISWQQMVSSDSGLAPRMPAMSR